MLNDTPVEQIVRREIDAVLLIDEGQSDWTLADPLLATGLNSLMLAQLLMQLEATTGVDPFGEERSIADVRTVGDLVAAYEAALAGSPEVQRVG
ncbi:phosphopantetheine-binding protein [Hamadaea tsunoensis]|uniref:phosphopantetheine-binding protein n=1 Tax=Hamadaea tsunoensis TaxID=53368 RepID=UPI00040E01C7|nr:phosphopantetheine-binding protein [Hamadaea tsunoensis]